MYLSKYALVDAFDALSNCANAETTWQCAIDIARALGVNAINTGAIDLEKGKLLWARSSMTQDWLETYVARDFAKVDPLIELFDTKISRKTIYCDPKSISRDQHGGHPQLSQALNNAGYNLLHGTKFIDPCETIGRMVTLCFHSLDRDAFDQNISQWTNVSALFAGFSMAPDTVKAPGVFVYGQPQLTTRETEVLSLLAKGLQTGRIAERLNLAEITVAKHFRTARQKLNAATREQALIKAMQYKLLKF